MPGSPGMIANVCAQKPNTSSHAGSAVSTSHTVIAQGQTIARARPLRNALQVDFMVPASRDTFMRLNYSHTLDFTFAFVDEAHAKSRCNDRQGMPGDLGCVV